jgi:beta-glucosidase
VYASVCADAAIPEMSEIFGARLADHSPVSEVTLKVVRPFGCLKVGDTFHYQGMSSEPRSWGATLDLAGAEVIAEDQNGAPAIVCYQAGKGKALLCAYPIEVYLAFEPAAFEHENPTYKLYRAFMEWAGIRPQVESNHPAVETAVLDRATGGYAVFTNHSPQAVEIQATTLMQGSEAFLLTENGKTKIAWEKGIWKLQIPAWNGCIVEWH